jgi:hypothetical protein
VRGRTRFLQLLARFEAHDGWCGPGVRSCAHWLQWRCGIGLGAAREKVRVTRALESLPKISSAFSRSELGYCMVRALTRKACPATEDDYLMIAKHRKVSHVRRLVRLHDDAGKCGSLAARPCNMNAGKCTFTWTKTETG